MNATRGRRDTISLYADILRAVGSGARKSRIVYRANLNFSLCTRYLGELLRMGMVEVKTHSPPSWAVTRRGREFMKRCGGLRGFLLR